MTDTTHSPAEVIQLAYAQQVGVDNRGASDHAVQSLTEAGYAIADLSTHAVVPRADINNLDAVVRVLGVEDSHVTPAEKVEEILAEVERLRAMTDTPHSPAQSRKDPLDIIGQDKIVDLVFHGYAIADLSTHAVVPKTDIEHLRDAIGRANGSEKGLHKSNDEEWSQGYAAGCSDTQASAVGALKRSSIYRALINHKDSAT